MVLSEHDIRNILSYSNTPLKITNIIFYIRKCIYLSLNFNQKIFTTGLQTNYNLFYNDISNHHKRVMKFQNTKKDNIEFPSRKNSHASESAESVSRVEKVTRKVKLKRRIK